MVYVHVDIQNWMEGTYDVLNKNSFFFVTSEVMDAESPIVIFFFFFFFWGGTIGSVYLIHEQRK